MENEEEDKKSESGPEVDGAVAVAYELNVYICIKFLLLSSLQAPQSLLCIF